MKILFLTPRLLYPVDRGDKVRPFHFARELSEKHELHLLSFIQSKGESEFAPYLKKYFKTIHTVYLPVTKSYFNLGLRFWDDKPFQVNYFKSNTYLNKLKELIIAESFDVVYAFHLRMAQYLQICSESYRILDFTDAVSLFMSRLCKHAPWYKRFVYSLEIARIRKYEKELIGRFEEEWIISEEDKAAVENGKSCKNLYVVTNGVETDYFSPSGKTYGRNIIFVGYMGVESVDSVLHFYNEIWPEIKAKTSGVKFYIIGANPPLEIKKLHNGVNIIITGFVSDLREYYRTASVMVAPMRFVAGMQNKILEAMSMEVPVVTTSFGNEGINAQNGKEIFVEDNPLCFADKVSFLLDNKDVCRGMGRKARAFVKVRYNWNNVNKRINAIEKILI